MIKLPERKWAKRDHKTVGHSFNENLIEKATSKSSMFFVIQMSHNLRLKALSCPPAFNQTLLARLDADETTRGEEVPSKSFASLNGKNIDI